MAICDTEDGSNIGNTGREDEPSTSTNTRRRKRNCRGVPRMQEREEREYILQWLHKFTICPVQSATTTIQWLLDTELKLITKSTKTFKDACDIYERSISIKTIEEIYEVIINSTQLFGCIDGNFDNKYYNTTESFDRLHTFLKFQFFYDEQNVFNFLTTLYKVLNRRNSKKNCIVITGPPNAGKSWFVRLIKSAMIVYGQIANMNRHSQFPFNNCVNKRFLHWDEPNFEPYALETLKTIFSGDETSANVKHQDFSCITKTPIIVTTNRYCFPTDEAYNSRIEHYQWNAASFLKDYEKQLNPLSLFSILKYYNLLNIQ